MKRTRLTLTIFTAFAVAGAVLPAMEAAATDIKRVRCEARGDRNKADVDAFNAMAGGTYTVTITSGGNTATQSATADAAGEVDFRCDSGRGEDPACEGFGAGFIDGGAVSVRVSGPSGSDSVSGVTCRTR